MEELYLKKIIAEQKSIKKTLDKVYSQKVQPNDLYITEKDLRMDMLEQ
jgi:propanediol dehydratase small subunit